MLFFAVFSHSPSFISIISVIHLFEIHNSNANATSYAHKVGITSLMLSQTNGAMHGLLAFIDKNRDLYVMTVRDLPGATMTTNKRKCEKLGIDNDI